MNIVNARISDVRWVNERCLSHWIFLDGDGWGCGFGGYCLKEEACYSWITNIMRVLDILEFNDEKLIGMIVRVDMPEWGGKIKSIGHPIKDIWFEPEKDL